jgi:hypothetical protein
MRPLTQADIDLVKLNPFAAGYTEKQIREWHNHCMAMESRFKGRRKNQDGQPSNVRDFILLGGMRDIEYIAAARAADEAKRFEQEFYLPILERWLAENADDEFFAPYLRKEIKRLRRILGLRQPPAERRTATRDRVRKFRRGGRPVERTEAQKAEDQAIRERLTKLIDSGNLGGVLDELGQSVKQKDRENHSRSFDAG